MLKRVACTLISLVLLAGIARAGPGTLRLKFYGVNGDGYDCDQLFGSCDFEVQSIFAYTTSAGTTTQKVGLGEKSNNNSPRWNYVFNATDFPTFSGSITFSIDLIENDSDSNGETDDYGAVTYNVAVTAGAAAKDVTLGGFWYVNNVYINVQFTCSPEYYGGTCDTRCSTNSGNCNNCNSAGACTACATGYSGTVWPCTLTPNWCTIPGTAVGGGTRSCANTINGVCTTSCNTGYTLSPGTAASTTCLSSRAWSSGNPGVCVVNNNYCTAKAAPANGQMSCTNFFALNSVCSFSCNNVGFTFAGASSLTCNSNTQASGSWSAGTDATCTLITNFCPTLPITNGVTSYSTLDQRLGSVASFTCNTGYTISDASRTATCQTGKTWSNSAPTCTATPGWCAPSAVNPSNGNVLCSASDTISSTCTYSCTNGYDLGGAASTQCQSSRSWSAAPWTTCQPKSPYCLQPPTPQFASASTCTRTIGGTCTFLCNNGYTQTSGDLSLTCASGSVSQGTWTGNSVVCGLKPAYCPTISSIANGAISSYTTTLGSVATFSCQPGFILTGATSTMCSALNAANGQWSNANPTCVYDEAYCPVPATYSHGTASCGATPRRIGTTCTYACDLGYITAPSTPASAICASGATWSSTPAAAPDCVENLAFCPDSQSADAHGSVSCSNSRARGSTCTAQCNAGYQLVGDQTTTCLDSAAWSKPRPACASIIIDYCGAAPIAPNGSTDCTGSGIDTVCTFNCNDGFQRASGAATTACQANTLWSVAPATACTLITNYCPALTAPTNGLIQAGCSRSITSQCSFACSSGFILTGATTIACQGGATWTHPAPTCNLITNFSPTVPVPSGATSFSTTESVEVSFASVVTASSSSIASQSPISVASDASTTSAVSASVSSDTSVLLASVVSTASTSAASVASSIVQHSSDTQASSSAAAVAAAVASVAVVAIIAAVLIVLRRRRLQRRSAARPKNAVKDTAGPVYQEAIEMTTSPLAHPTPEPTDSANPIYHEASELTGSSMLHSTRAHRAEGSSSAYATAGQRQPEPLYQALATPSKKDDMVDDYDYTMVYDYESAYVAGSNSRRVREGLTIVKHLASGNFGDVALGQVPFSVLPERARTLLGPAAPETVQVAVKSLKSDADEKSRKDFESEAKLMAPFVHPNVVRLLAALVESEPHLVLLEFVQYGDLRSLLQKSKKQSFKWSENEQIHAIRQIALGMEYLGTLHFVHRDLAARNCLVGQGMVVKIADFGLSRELADENDYYRMETRGKLPVKWMAPETMTFRKFSSMSDVWSFGVTAWECCCYGEMPYGKLSGRDTLAHVEAGGRLPQPEYCMLELYNMMMSCWNMTPEFRPSFSQLVKVLAGFQDGTTIREIGAMV